MPKWEPINSRMSIAGHPIHPILIHFPVAALLGLAATDLAWVLTGDPFWARAGLWLAGVGAAGGWGAGLVGVIDLLFEPGIRRLITGWCHSLIAVMMLSVATFNWMLRWDDAAVYIQPWGLYLSLLTAALIIPAGIFGGQLVYEHGVGVGPDA